MARPKGGRNKKPAQVATVANRQRRNPLPTILPIGNKGFGKRPPRPRPSVAYIEGAPDMAVTTAAVVETKTRREKTSPGRQCKERPNNTKSKGGNSRRFIPYCGRKS